MFGKKEAMPSDAPPKREVPVFTVHSLPRPYETICTVFSGKINTAYPSHVLRMLGQAGGEIPECDAVIGILVIPASGSQIVNAYGTAVRYV